METPLTSLALVALAALACGLVMDRLRQPALLGYIIAGILLGPSGLGLVESREHIMLLAEFGILVLLFLVGMELPLESFRGVWRRAAGVAILQVILGVALMAPLTLLPGWTWQTGVLFGFMIALSSTAVVVKLLTNMNIIASPPGRIIVGILVGQDILFIPMMLIVGSFTGGEAGEAFGVVGVLRFLLALAMLGGILTLVARAGRLRLPFGALSHGNRELTVLRAAALCFGGAALAGVVGLAPAYGAFLTGLTLGRSDEREDLIGGIRPLENLLMMLFFVSLGMLLDLAFIFANLWLVLIVLAAVVVAKTFVSILLIRLVGEPWPHAVIAGVLLAQIGEFSLLLGQAGVANGVLTSHGHNLVVAATVLSLMMTPLWLFTARRIVRLALTAGSWREVVERVSDGVAQRLLRKRDDEG